jgi:hypothetical protein
MYHLLLEHTFVQIIQSVCVFPKLVIERRSQVVGTPASYSAGFGFKYRLGDRLSWLMEMPE